MLAYLECLKLSKTWPKSIISRHQYCILLLETNFTQTFSAGLDMLPSSPSIKSCTLLHSHKSFCPPSSETVLLKYWFVCHSSSLILFWPIWSPGSEQAHFACGCFLARFRPCVCGQVHWQVREEEEATRLLHCVWRGQLTVQASSAASTKEGQVTSYWIKHQNIQLEKRGTKQGLQGLQVLSELLSKKHCNNCAELPLHIFKGIVVYIVHALLSRFSWNFLWIVCLLLELLSVASTVVTLLHLAKKWRLEVWLRHKQPDFISLIQEK